MCLPHFRWMLIGTSPINCCVIAEQNTTLATSPSLFQSFEEKKLKLSCVLEGLLFALLGP